MRSRPRKWFLVWLGVGVLGLFGVLRVAPLIWVAVQVYRRSDPVKIVRERRQWLARVDPAEVRAWAKPKLESNSGEERWTDFPKGIIGLGIFKENDGSTNYIMIPFGSHGNVAGLAVGPESWRPRPGFFLYSEQWAPGIFVCAYNN